MKNEELRMRGPSLRFDWKSLSWLHCRIINGLRVPHPARNRKHSRFMPALPTRKFRRLSLGLLACWLLTACSEATIWSDKGDACVHESEKPPLRRVVNYSDNTLCQRKRPARTPPNPRVRMDPQMPES